MNWDFYFVVTGACLVLHLCGVFRWVARRLNEKPAPASEVSIMERQQRDILEALAYQKSDIERLRGDVDKLKLALNFKEFKPKG